MLREPHSTWVKLLNTRYASNRKLMEMFQAKQNLVQSSHVILKGMRWEVCNRQSVYFWNDIWATNFSLSAVALKQLSTMDIGAIVVDYWVKDND